MLQVISFLGVMGLLMGLVLVCAVVPVVVLEELLYK